MDLVCKFGICILLMFSFCQAGPQGAPGPPGPAGMNADKKLKK